MLCQRGYGYTVITCRARSRRLLIVLEAGHAPYKNIDLSPRSPTSKPRMPYYSSGLALKLFVDIVMDGGAKYPTPNSSPTALMASLKPVFCALSGKSMAGVLLSWYMKTSKSCCDLTW
jgi:hypothetical protein